MISEIKISKRFVDKLFANNLSIFFYTSTVGPYEAPHRTFYENS